MGSARHRAGPGAGAPRVAATADDSEGAGGGGCDEWSGGDMGDGRGSKRVAFCRGNMTLFGEAKEAQGLDLG